MNKTKKNGREGMKKMDKIKKYFSDWTTFEKCFLTFGVLASILSTLCFQGTIIECLYTLLYFITALLMSKGKVECYFVGFVSVFFYAIVSYNQGYYGELLITAFLTFPIMIIGIISWLRHQDKEENVVIINSLDKKELAISLVSQIPLYFVYYFILKLFNTELIVISTFSVVTSVLASYYEARRSDLSLPCYIANDCFIITLWLIPIIQGDISLISVLVGPVLLLMNDIYGTYNWQRMKKKQSKKTNLS